MNIVIQITLSLSDIDNVWFNFDSD